MNPSLPQAPDDDQLKTQAATLTETLNELDPLSAHHNEARKAFGWLADNQAHLNDVQIVMFDQAVRLCQIADHAIKDANTALREALTSITRERLTPTKIPAKPESLHFGLPGQNAYLATRKGDTLTGCITAISATNPMAEDDTERTPGTQYLVLEVPVGWE